MDDTVARALALNIEIWADMADAAATSKDPAASLRHLAGCMRMGKLMLEKLCERRREEGE